jgi:hypothetical protein
MKSWHLAVHMLFQPSGCPDHGGFRCRSGEGFWGCRWWFNFPKLWVIIVSVSNKLMLGKLQSRKNSKNFGFKFPQCHRRNPHYPILLSHYSHIFVVTVGLGDIGQFSPNMLQTQRSSVKRTSITLFGIEPPSLGLERDIKLD